jgi:hypothetical protein
VHEMQCVRDSARCGLRCARSPVWCSHAVWCCSANCPYECADGASRGNSVRCTVCKCAVQLMQSGQCGRINANAVNAGVHSVQCSVYGDARCAVYSVQCAVYGVQCAVMQRTMCSVRYYGVQVCCLAHAEGVQCAVCSAVSPPECAECAACGECVAVCSCGVCSVHCCCTVCTVHCMVGCG